MQISCKKIKEMETSVRHKHDQANFLRKEYESLKRQYKKKVSIVDSIKQILPQLQEQLIDQQHTVRQYKEQSADLKKTIQNLKDDLDNQIAQVLQQEGLEKSKKEVRACCVLNFLVASSSYLRVVLFK